MINREIIFRGLPLNDSLGYGKTFVYGDLIQYAKNEVFILEQNSRSWDILEAGIMVEPSTVGQLTYTKDIENNEIYEGDVVKGRRNRYFKVVYDNFNNRFAFESLTNEERITLNRHNIEDFEFKVVGNKYLGIEDDDVETSVVQEINKLLLGDGE